MSNLIFSTTSTDHTIVEAVIDAAKVHGRKRIAIEDPLSRSADLQAAPAATAILGAKLMPLAAEGRAIGVMLPNSNGAVVTVLSLLSGGRVPAMINFTAGAANVLGACRAAQVDTILTSRAFVEKARWKISSRASSRSRSRIVYLEDIRQTVTFADKLRGAAAARQAAGRRASPTTGR